MVLWLITKIFAPWTEKIVKVISDLCKFDPINLQSFRHNPLKTFMDIALLLEAQMMKLEMQLHLLLKSNILIYQIKIQKILLKNIGLN